PPPLVQHLDVVGQVHLGVAQHVAAVAVTGDRARGREVRAGRQTRRVERPDAWDPGAAVGRGRGVEAWLIDLVRIERLQVVGHQKNLSGTMIVSPGCTMSSSFARLSFFSPFST